MHKRLASNGPDCMSERISPDPPSLRPEPSRPDLMALNNGASSPARSAIKCELWRALSQGQSRHSAQHAAAAQS